MSKLIVEMNDEEMGCVLSFAAPSFENLEFDSCLKSEAKDENTDNVLELLLKEKS